LHPLVEAADVPINLPPPVILFNYPIAIGTVLIVALTAIILYVAGRFDPTKGPLTISILIVLGMLGATAYCLMFTIPPDDITPSVVGGLTAGFGAVIAYWLGRRTHDPPDPPAEP
jgi:hypothetical protein